MLAVDKHKVRRSFADASSSYDQAAHLQRTVGKALLAAIEPSALTGTVLDLGCGTGFLSAELLGQGFCQEGQLIALDIALPMLQAARSKLKPQQPSYVCADADRLPFAAHSIDHIVSNLALQWCSQLGDTCAELRRVLTMGGQLRFSTFGPQTLQELKAAWRTVDGHPHVNHFYSEAQIHSFLQQAGFSQIEVQSVLYCNHYPSVLALTQELKALGAQTVAARHSHITRKSHWQAMLAAYEKSRQDGLIPATFEVITIKANA
ncbi:malonyl-ACP O-methyltransferase BioC [Methylosoma difficile]